MGLFELNSDLRIGTVVEVAGTSIKVEVDEGLGELRKAFDGRVYPVGQIGSVVKIHFGRRLLFAYVRLLRMRSEEELPAGSDPLPPHADQRVMEADLFAEATWDTGSGALSFKRGLTTYPLPRQGVYMVTRDEAERVYQAAEGRRDTEFDPLVPIGFYVGTESVPCRANIDRMFGMHCAVLGSTGSGKSGAVAAILHGVLDHTAKEGAASRPRIVIIDPHGEYGRAFGERAIVYRAYDPLGTEADDSTPLVMPYWLMSGEEFRMMVIGKTEREATSQNNIVYKAIRHARLVEAGLIEPAKDDWIGKAFPGKMPEEPRLIDAKKHQAVAAFDRDKPRPFRLEEFIRHIDHEQSLRVNSKNLLESDTNSELKSHRSILDKLSVLCNDPRVRFLMSEYNPAGPKLADVIAQFVGTIGGDPNDHRDVRIIDISGLPNEVAGPLTAAIARLLFQYKLYQTMEERRADPVLLVCEEAHRYVPDSGEAEYAAAQTSIRRIAREGRKYGLGLMLVSQRPADIESTVISQCSSWVVLRLTNASDQQHVARFLPDGLQGMTKLLPSLSRQEAIFVGEAAAIPARIRLNHLPEHKLPKSENVAFAKGWAGPPTGSELIGQIATRMTRDFTADLDVQAAE